MSKILVTGGSGFLGSRCIVAALAAGHEVRTTVRTLDKSPQVDALVKSACGGIEPDITYYAADLTHDDGWAEAIAGCDYVLHTASPFPAAQPEDPDDLIIPARDGTLRVLRAARDGGVQRVVLTSSFAAIGYGEMSLDHVFTEDDWTPIDAPNQAYIRSKTSAERAAWDFVRDNGSLELSVVNPTGIFGPLLGSQLSASIGLIKALLDGAFPVLPEMWFGIVDVRDVADLHLRAMTNPAAAGERFIAVSGEPLSLTEVAGILRDRLGPAAARISTKSAGPSPETKRRRSSSAKARVLLEWAPRSGEDAILASAESLLALNAVTVRA
ncbi:MAG: aldehyde reductase [Candidatus Eremiobacteraeota bacterium]|nr:aldehyde reductase [Candidatus Eremiobacteraeota bacterium]